MEKNIIVLIGKLVKLLASNQNEADKILVDFFKNAPPEINTQRKFIQVFSDIYSSIYGQAIKNMMIMQFTGEEFVKAAQVWPALKTVDGYRNLVPSKFVETFEGEFLDLPL